MDICPKDPKGRHKPISLAAFGDSTEKVVRVFCKNCNKVLYEKEETTEVAFPGIARTEQPPTKQ